MKILGVEKSGYDSVASVGVLQQTPTLFAADALEEPLTEQSQGTASTDRYAEFDRLSRECTDTAQANGLTDKLLEDMLREIDAERVR